MACGILDAAIAEDAGGDWPARAREAVLELASGDGDDDDSILLLAKLRDAFTAESAITSRKLVQFVRGDEELPFGELNPIMIAAGVKPCGIRLRTVRADDATSTAT